MLRALFLRLTLLPDMSILLDEEKLIAKGRNRFIELFTVPRNRTSLVYNQLFELTKTIYSYFRPCFIGLFHCNVHAVRIIFTSILLKIYPVNSSRQFCECKYLYKPTKYTHTPSGGVNVIVYYCSTIFTQSGFSIIQAFGASFGFGALNFLFALPAVYTIDLFGRRALLLITFPLMSLFLLLTGFAFWIPGQTARIAVVALGIYLFDS
jgi:hypothetical protein